MEDKIRFEFDYAPNEEMPVERDARIFEAGDYPDKGISISESDLDTIVEGFIEVPVKVEHTDSPLDPLGMVKKIWRRGRELFGRLAFPADMAAFLQRRRIKSLSVALLRDPLSLAEVSIVLSPRIPTAEMFSDDQNEEVNAEMSDEQIRMNNEIRDLKFALKSKDVDVRLSSLKSQGKITPASEAFAREILLKGDGKIAFGDGVLTVSELFDRFLEAQPKVVPFGENSPGHKGSASGLLSSDDEELLAKLGVTQELVERYAI